MSLNATEGQVPEWTIADRLRKAREYADLEQLDLAERIGVSRTTVSNNERGEVKPRRIVLNAWALATGVDRIWLETGIAPEPGDPDGGDSSNVRHQGLEPRTRWLMVSDAERSAS